jgi:DNA-binding CsgD family transcriptional regulator
MKRRFGSSDDERAVALQLVEALGSSLDLRVVLKEAYPLLTRLAPADYGELGVSSSANPGDFEWTVAALPAAFFGAYAEMAPHDFVRSSVARQPNVVLRDQDMIGRRELEHNVMYRRAREVGAPIEQVMAVMLHVDERWQSGLSLYRERRRPFSERERARLQRFTPALANAVRNCRLFGLATDWEGALDRLLADATVAVVLAASNATEIARSRGATALLEKWFERHERPGRGLPAPLAAALAAAVSDEAPGAFRRSTSEASLDVSILPLTGYRGEARWLLRLDERSAVQALPAQWCRLLTPREQQVTARILRGWDNRLIATELDCGVATVKRHLQNIFAKLGLESRTMLVVRARENARD